MSLNVQNPTSWLNLQLRKGIKASMRLKRSSFFLYQFTIHFFTSTDSRILAECFLVPLSCILHASKTSTLSMPSTDAGFRKNLAIFYHSCSSSWAPVHLNLGENASLGNSFGKKIPWRPSLCRKSSFKWFCNLVCHSLPCMGPSKQLSSAKHKVS
jgi:hypothetical protein